MATLTPSLSLSSHHHNYYHSPSNSLSLPFHATLLFNRTHFNPKHSFVCLASTRKARPSRKLMSDDELCNSLREFVALIGLPEGHVPSTKQLTLHGRKDLANIVRRRGHKLVEELLAYYANPVMDGCDSWENMNGESSGSTGHKEIGQEATVNDSIEESIDIINDDTAVSSTFVMTHEAAISSDDKRPLSIESPVSMQEKVENFMKYGELDVVEDDLRADLKWNDVEESTSSDSGDNFDSGEPEIHGQERASHIPVRSSNAGLNGTLLLRKPSPPTPEARYTRNTHLSTQIQQKDDFDHEKRSELKTTQERKRENEIEIDRLKLMLHQKELELSRLKEEIEKEKQALSIMQTKVEDEISKAQKLISEKETELLAAEESLSGLVEAKIQYSGEGQMVEVAGSFNGWHQKIKMEPQISSVTIDPIGSRKPRLWATTLWLYPGVYEMKFIIDGHWKIDPQKEITNKRGLENNILRVDRPYTTGQVTRHVHTDNHASSLVILNWQNRLSSMKVAELGEGPYDLDASNNKQYRF